MSDPFSDMLLEEIKLQSDAQQAAIEQGVLIGRREMKPLIRELVNALGALDPNVEGYYVGDKISKLIARAKEALEND